MENSLMKSTLPETGFVRLPHIIGDANAQPPIPAIIPVSKSTWWAGVKSGRFPRPIKLGPRITAWRVEDIRQEGRGDIHQKLEKVSERGQTGGSPGKRSAPAAAASRKRAGKIAGPAASGSGVT